MKVKVSVDQDSCTGCGICYSDLPEVYEDDGDGISQVLESLGGDGAVIEGDLAEKAMELKDECPAEALVTEEV